MPGAEVLAAAGKDKILLDMPNVLTLKNNSSADAVQN
jgi:hypothetical protein